MKDHEEGQLQSLHRGLQNEAQETIHEPRLREVHEVADSHLGKFHIREQLVLVSVRERGDALDLEYDCPSTMRSMRYAPSTRRLL